MPRPEPLPDVRQRNAHDCATAAWRCVYKYHHGRDARVRDLSNPIHGTDPSTLEAAIRVDRRWNVRSGESFVSDLKHDAETWRPPICVITYPNDSDSHYVVVGGIWRGKVWFHDVADGWSSLKIEDWQDIWHGTGRYAAFVNWSLTAWPNNKLLNV